MVSKSPKAQPLPKDALDALLAAKKKLSQADIAKRLGVSDGTVSNALKGRYIGNVDKLAERVRGEFLKQTVDCPIWGEISTRICQDERSKPFVTNPIRIRIWRACQVCTNNPNFKGGQS